MTYKSHPISDYLSILTPGTALVDVREPAEFAEGSLPDARHIPLGELAERTGELDRTKPVLLFCRSGGRSGQAAQFLTDAGYDNVTNLDGGMLAWEEQTAP